MSENRISFSKLFWPSFLAVLIAGLIGMLLFFLVIGGIIGSFGDFGPQPLNLKDNTVLHVKLSGTISDIETESLDPYTLKVDKSLNIAEIIIGLQKAANDKKIKGIFLEMKNPEMGMATANELRSAIEDFQHSGKFVVAYLAGEQVSQRDYYVSSVCNEVYGMHGATFLWHGLQAESYFFKKLLDELQMSVIVVRGKENDFKSAVEPFYLNQMSDSSRHQTKELLDNLWSNVRNDVAKSTATDTAYLDSLAYNLNIRNLTHAKRFRLIDKNLYRHEVLYLIKKKAGIEDNATLRLQKFKKYAKEAFEDNQKIAAQKNHIAVINAQGEVQSEGPQVSTVRMMRLLKEVRENDQIKGVVLRINSPGGSAMASEEIWKEISLTAAKKKLYVSMGDYAASGGYYIATPANKIFASPMTITGSIGVFGLLPYGGDFMQKKLGINTDEVLTHQFGELSLTRRPNETEIQMIQTEIDTIYQLFVKRVSGGRKISKDEVQKIARGRVWSGSSALKLGLVDAMGGLQKTISELQKELGIEKVVFYPKKKPNTIDMFLSILDEQLEDDFSDSKMSIGYFLSYFEKFTQIIQMKGIQMRLPFVLRIH